MSDENSGAYELLKENARLLTMAQKFVAEKIQTLSETGKGPSELVKQLLALSRQIPAVAKEIRSYEKEHSTMVKEMSIEEKRKLMAEFYRTMPPEHQKAFLDEIVGQR